MKPRAANGVSAQLLAAYVDGDVTPSQAATVERALAQSPELRRRADQLKRIAAALSEPVADLGGVDVTASVRAAATEIARARRAGAEAPRRRWFWGWPALAGLAAAGLATVMLVVARPARHPGPGQEGAEQAGMRAKSAGGLDPAAPQRWAGISAYRVAGQGAPERLGGHMSREDGLLFTYTNLGARPFTYLMIFAVEASGQVRWFHPAYQQAGTNPQSIAIEANANVPLAEVVRHPFAAGPVTIQALFSRHPLRVDDVEAWLARRPAVNGAPPWPDSYRQILTTSVDPPR